MGVVLRAALYGWVATIAMAQAPDLAEAMKLAAAGQYARAEALLAQISRARPQDAEARYRLGVVLLRQHKLEGATRELHAAAQLAPQVAPVWLALTEALLQAGDVQGALEAGGKADLAIRPMPASAAAQLRSALADAYRTGRQPARAVEQMQQAIRLNPNEPAFYLRLAGLFLDHRTPEPAVAVLEAAVERFPKNLEMLRLLGLACYAQGRATKAIDSFLRITEIEPDADVGYASLETLLPEAGDRLPAIIARLRGFSERNSATPLGPYLLAQALALSTPGAPEIEPLLRDSVRRDPTFWPGWFALHKPLIEVGKHEEAARVLAKAIELKPDYAPAHYSLAQAYMELGNREGAREQRRIHHELVSQERAAAEARRAAMPMLPYKLVRP